ncbi:MAG: hypothetical protein PWQ57_1924 [Desulfovibrionales bacterium]|nr:hypothetical protein [Desulfovibrionales bacterium]
MSQNCSMLCRKRFFRALALGLLAIALSSSFAAPARADQGALEWSFSTTGEARCGVAVSPNGTLYTGTDQAYFYAITPSGALEKPIDLPGTIRYVTPAISHSGTIYIGNGNGFLYAFSPDLSPQWIYNSGSAIESSPAISSNGTIYILNNGGEFHALYPDKTVWVAIDTGTGQFSRSGVSISKNGTCYFADNSGVIYSWTPGASSVTTMLSTGASSTGVIAISSNGTLYVPVGSELWAVSPAGTKLWAYPAGGTVLSPAISDNGTIYVTNYGSTSASTKSVHAVNPDGTAQWTYAPSEHFGTGVDYQVLNGPTLSSNGTIYFPISGQVCALSPAGSLKWCYDTGSTSDITQPVALAPNGTLYFGSASSKIFAVTGDGHGLAYSAWPNYRHDSYGTGHAQPFRTLPDSGQTMCYDASGATIACSGSGQDGQYNGSQPRFELYEDNSNGNITLDLNTNLMWQYGSSGQYGTVQDAKDYCSALAIGGYTDWRLPSIAELLTTVNYNATDGSFSAFRSLVDSPYRLWSSTPSRHTIGSMYYLTPKSHSTSVVSGSSSGSGYCARCVRGTPAPSSRMAVMSNRTMVVKDATTGLVWQRDWGSAGTPNWENALSYCEGLTLGGWTDWRLPNINELMTTVDYNNASLAVAPVFTNVHQGVRYFSSTSRPGASNARYAMTLYFDTAALTGGPKLNPDGTKTSTSYYTVCVRNGSAGSPDRTAAINNAPSGTTTATTAMLTINGTDINRYRYKLDSGNYSDVIGSTAKIRLSGLSQASHTVSVLGISGDPGKLQDNPTTATWTVGAGSSEVKTKDGTNPHTDPNAADADTDITYPEYQETQYSGTVNTILTDLGYSAMGSSLGNYSAWQDKVTDATALGYLKANDSTDIKKGINLLSTGGSVDRVLTGMVNASCTSLTNGYCLFVRNTTNLAKTYHRSNLRYAKVMGDTVTLVELASTEFSASVKDDIYVYLRKADGSVVTDSFTGEVSTCVWIKDNGAYDAISTAGTVADPGFVTSLSSSSSSSSSTGCILNPNAGFSLEWLLALLAPLAVWLRLRP